MLTVADLELDENSHEVTRAGVEVHLTATEFELLRYLMRNERVVLSKAQILDRVWKYDFQGQSNIVELYIGYLRKKVDNVEPKLIHTDPRRRLRRCAHHGEMNRVSLRTRLVALAVLLVAFAVTAVGAATYVALHSYLYTTAWTSRSTDLADNPGRAICSPAQRRSGRPPTGLPTSVLVTPGRAGQHKIACRGYPISRQLALPADDARRLASVTTETGPFTVHTPGGRVSREHHDPGHARRPERRPDSGKPGRHGDPGPLLSGRPGTP